MHIVSTRLPGDNSGLYRRTDEMWQAATDEEKVWKFTKDFVTCSSAVGEMWQAATDEEKAAYNAESEVDRARYKAEMAAYRDRCVGSQGIKTSPVYGPNGEKTEAGRVYHTAELAAWRNRRVSPASCRAEGLGI